MDATIVNHLKILAFIVPVALGTWIAAFRLGFFHLPNDRESKRIPFKELIAGFLLFLGSHLVAQPLAWIFLTSRGMEGSLLETNREVQGWVNVFAMIFSFLVVLMYTRFCAPQTARCLWGGIRKKGKENFALGILSLVICYPAVMVIGQIIRLFMAVVYKAPEVDQVAVEALKSSFQNRALLGMMIFCVIFIVPVVEEILFRGCLQTWVRGWLGPRGAIGLSSFVFALFHYSYSQGLSNVELLASLFFLSCFLGLIYEKKGSLLAPIGLHMAFNGLNVAVLLW